MSFGECACVQKKEIVKIRQENTQTKSNRKICFILVARVLYCVCIHLHKRANSTNKMPLALVCSFRAHFSSYIVEHILMEWFAQSMSLLLLTQYQLQLKDCWPLTSKLKIFAKKTNISAEWINLATVFFFCIVWFESKRKCSRFSISERIAFPPSIFNY